MNNNTRRLSALKSSGNMSLSRFVANMPGEFVLYIAMFKSFSDIR